MKKFILFTILMMSAMQLFADTEQQSISLNHKGGGRSGATAFDMPTVYYTIDDFYNQEVSINGAGVVSYYNVEISSASTGYVEISTVVNGTYDTIDVSSLSAGTHVITIESPGPHLLHWLPRVEQQQSIDKVHHLRQRV